MSDATDPTTSLAAFAAAWRDDPATHQRIADAFCERVNATPWLKAHRDRVEANGLGFGERAFHWVWRLVADDMLIGGRFLEVGVWKGQSVVAVGRCLERRNDDRQAAEFDVPEMIVGVSNYDGRPIVTDRPDLLAVVLDEWANQGIVWPDFVPLIGDTQDARVRRLAAFYGPYDAVYIDADHSYGSAKADLAAYMPMVRPGGLLLADDAAWNLSLPDGWFRGFEGSSRAVDEILPPKTPHPDWTHLGSVGHLRIWRRAGG